MTVSMMTRARRAGSAIAALVAVAVTVSACGDRVEATAIDEPSAAAPQPVDAAPQLAADAPIGQLPTGVRPTGYDLALTIDPRQATFSGVADITVELDAAADGIWLHGLGLSVADAQVTVGDADPIPAIYTEVLETGVARLSFRDRIGPGEARVRLAYSAAFDPALAGMFRVREQDDYYALVKSESIQARKAFPGFDEPGFKAPFRVALTIPEDMVAIANGPEIARTDLGDGTHRLVFAETPPLPTYLISLAVGPFDVVDAGDLPPTAVRDRAVPVRGFARRGKGDELAFILSITQPFVETFEAVTGTPYPYAKLDIVAAPDWPSGATELAAAPTYREDIILAPLNPAPAQKRRIVSIHAHEIAHMWFGDLVTPPWWDDLWLKEGFAVWGEPVAARPWDPNGGYELDQVRDMLRGFAADSLASARAVREPITRNEDIRNAYDGITYSKGSSVLAMTEAYLGEERWRRGLRAYFRRFADGVADADDFYAVMGEAAEDPAFEASLRGFVERPGTPLLTVSVACPAGGMPKARIAQSRYRPVGSPIDPAETWIVPVCLAYGDDDGGAGRTCALVEDAETVVPLTATRCPTWLTPNAGATGYYRFSFAPDSAAGWDELAVVLDRITPGEALVAIDSAVAAFEAGAGDAQELLALFERAARSTEQDIVVAPLGPLRRYRARLIGDDEAGAAALAAYVRDLYAERYQDLAGASSEADRLLRRDLRAALAELGQDPGVRAELADAAARFVGLGAPRDPAALNADEFALAARVGVDELGAAFVDALIAERAAIDDPVFDAAALPALGRARAPEAAAVVREFALTEAPARSAYAILDAQMRRPGLEDEAFAFVSDNLDVIAQRIPSQWRRRAPRFGLAFCGTARIAELEAVIADHADLLPGHERALAQTTEQIALCAALRAEQAGPFKAALTGAG